MLTCPKCKELNGNDRATCYKCGTKLAETTRNSSSKRAFCPNCGMSNPAQAVNCSSCGSRLNAPRTSFQQSNSYDTESHTWMYVLAVLIPLLGIILGCISYAKDDRDLGKKLIITSVVVWLALIVFWMLFVSSLF